MRNLLNLLYFLVPLVSLTALSTGQWWPGLSTVTTYNPVVPEICDNGIDDDGDGFVDFFDTDCPCDSLAYQAFCPIACVQLPDSFPSIKLRLKWQTEIIVNEDHIYPNIVVGDVNHDNITDIVTKKYLTTGGGNNFTNSVAIYSGMTGQKLHEYTSIPRNIDEETFFISIADVNSDGEAEYFFSRGDTLVCLNPNGSVRWKSDRLGDDGGYAVNIADFNGDGIPEVYKGNDIVNAQNGKLLVSGNAGAGCNLYTSNCGAKHTIAADLRPSPGLELAAGNTVYEISITNPNGTAGNTMTAILADSPVRDGFTSIGDIDGDEQLDIIVIRSSQSTGSGIWVWNPRTKKVIARATAGRVGGIAFIGNVHGDCTPEIGVTFQNQLRMYRYNGTTNLQLLYNLPTTDGSGYTGVTMFDFNQDGKNELVYRDETLLKVMEGSTGNTLSAYAIMNGTGMEYPVVADIDGDHQAEILVSGNTSNPSQQRLFCFESNGAPWAPARNVWNQPGYHVTNVNDDLTIPSQPQNQAKIIPGTETCLLPTCQAPYNAFMAQATFRTQQGCVQFPAPDIALNMQSAECLGDSISVCFSVVNEGDQDLFQQSISYSIWSVNPTISNGEVLAKFSNTMDLIKGKPVSFCKHFDASEIPSTFYLVANDPGSTASPHAFPQSDLHECRYENNIDSITLAPVLTSIDLGLDVTGCETEQIVLTIPSNYMHVQWSPPELVSCDTCNAVQLLSSVTAQLSVLLGQGVCRQVDTFLATILHPVHIDLDTLLCEGQQLNFHDSLITTSGQFIFADPSCDSVFTAIVSFANIDTVMLSPSICEGDSVWFNAQWIYTDGVYQSNDFNSRGCDSITILTLSLLDQIPVADTFRICAGDSILLGGNWERLQGTYTTIIPGILCDTLRSTWLWVDVRYQTEHFFEACPGDSVLIDQFWITQSDTVEQMFQTVRGCDSVVINHFYFPPPTQAPTLLIDCEMAVVNAIILIDPIWDITWSNGDHSMTTQYDRSGMENIQLTVNGCEAEYEFEIPSIPNLALLPLWNDTLILEDHPFTINLDLPIAEWSVHWTPASIFSCATCLNTTIQTPVDVTIHAQFLHISGCEYLQDFAIHIEPVVDLFVPNVFSPNQDAINDVWLVTSPGERLEMLRVTIFDRWGDQLADWKEVTRVEWNGTFREKLLNPGVFTYTILYLDQENNPQIKKGNITLLR